LSAPEQADGWILGTSPSDIDKYVLPAQAESAVGAFESKKFVNLGLAEAFPLGAVDVFQIGPALNSWSSVISRFFLMRLEI
jgi:hypothetical protein